MIFTIPKEEMECINAWYEELKPELIRITRERLSPDVLATLMEDEVYCGAIGGGLSYTFTPTGLGVIISVTENITGKTLNATEASGWVNFG